MNNIVKKILKESSFDNIIHLIPDLGKELGAGVNGVVYEYFGKALKITMNLEDASLALLMKQRNPKHFTTIFSIKEVYQNEKATGVYLIEREKLSQLSKIEYDILFDFDYIIQYYFDGEWKDEQFLEAAKQYDPALAERLYKEYKKLYIELSRFKMYDLGSKNLGRKKDGTLAAFDAETNLSFSDSYKKFDKFYVDSMEEQNDLIESTLKELDNSNSPAMPDIMPNEFSAYMAEATDESMTMETGAIPNPLDENDDLNEVNYSIIVEYITRDVFKGKKLASAISSFFKKFNGKTNPFLGRGVLNLSKEKILDEYYKDKMQTFIRNKKDINNENVVNFFTNYFGLDKDKFKREFPSTPTLNEKKLRKVLNELFEEVNKANPHDKGENGEYLIDKIKEGILPFNFLEALIDYQTSTFGLKQLKRKIERYSISLPILKDFKKAPSYLYRVIKISKGWKSYETGIYSYTISAKMALNFFENDYLGNDRSGENVAIIKIKTDPKRVILNIDELLNSKLYSKSLRFYKLDWGNENHDEKDILYNQPQITRKNLYMIYNKNKWVKL